MVALSQMRRLEVSADFDASGYKRGADEKVQADERMVAGDRNVARASQATDRRVKETGGSLEKLRRQIDPTYRSQQQLATGSRILDRALSTGRITTEEHTRQMELLRQKYGEVRTAKTQMVAANDNVTGSFAKMQAGLLALRPLLAAVGVGLSIGGMGRLVSGTLAAADGMAKLADRVGVGTDALQEYQFHASQAGVTSDTLRGSLEQLTRRVGEARTGQGELGGMARRLGIDLTSTESALRGVAAAMSRTNDASARAQIANAAFGRSGMAMINMLKDGTAGLDQMAAEARRLGLVLDGELLRGAEVINDEFDTLNKILRTNLDQGLLESLNGQFADLRNIAVDAGFPEGMQTIGRTIGWVTVQAAEAAMSIATLAAALRQIGGIDGAPGNLGGVVGWIEEFGQRGLRQIGLGRSRDPRDVLGARLDILREQLAEAERMDPDAMSGLGGVDGYISQIREEMARVEAEMDRHSARLELTTPRGGAAPPPLPDLGRDRRSGGTRGTAQRMSDEERAAQRQAEAIRRVTEAMRFEEEQIFRTSREQHIANQLRAAGIDSAHGAAQAISDLAGRTYDLAQASKALDEIMRDDEGGVFALGRAAEAAREEFGLLEQMADRALDRIGSSMTDMFVRGEGAAASWKNVVMGVLSEISQEMFRLAAINPLKNLLRGSDNQLPTLGGIFGSIGSSLFSGSSMTSPGGAYANMGSLSGGEFAMGGAFDRGMEVHRFSQGGIFDRPTRFAIGEMGEAGPEAIMPLERMPGGKLGVRAQGSPANGNAAGPVNYYSVDARGATDPGMVEAAVARGIAMAAPGIVKRSSAYTLDQFERSRRVRPR
ncbi:MAG: hypothetical protein ACK4QW_09995 [Alphaproteobacteria bacterium]